MRANPLGEGPHFRFTLSIGEVQELFADRGVKASRERFSVG